jgi:hypothetical protein
MEHEEQQEPQEQQAQALLEPPVLLARLDSRGWMVSREPREIVEPQAGLVLRGPREAQEPPEYRGWMVLTVLEEPRVAPEQPERASPERQEPRVPRAHRGSTV